MVIGVEGVVVVGLSSRSPGGALLEAAAQRVRTDRLHETLRALAARPGTELLLLHTCLRLEVYAVTDQPDRTAADLSAALTEATGTGQVDLEAVLETRRGDAAVRHLFGVAAGLDSVVVGEPQILGQVRQALVRARAAGTVGAALGRLVERAVHVGRRVRAETGLATAVHSVAEPALQRAADVLGPLTGRRVLVVGAGTMARLTVSALRRHSVGTVTIVSRTEQTGRALAARTGATWLPLADPARLRAALAAADLVVSATSADHPVVSAGLLAPTPQPRVLVDLARPADIDPAVTDRPGVTLVTLDDLRGAAGPDQLTVARARRLVDAEVEVERARRRAATAATHVTQLRAWAHGIADAELLRIHPRLTGADPGTAEAVEQAVRRTVNKLLHHATVHLQADPAAQHQEIS